MAQLVEHPTFDLGSGHDPRVVGWGPVSGSVLSVESAKDSLSLSLSLSLCPSPPLALSVSNLKKENKF